MTPATAYELRSQSGRPMLSFDDVTRAKQYQEQHAQRHGVKTQLWRVTRVEERVG